MWTITYLTIVYMSVATKRVNLIQLALLSTRSSRQCVLALLSSHKQSISAYWVAYQLLFDPGARESWSTFFAAGSWNSIFGIRLSAYLRLRILVNDDSRALNKSQKHTNKQDFWHHIHSNAVNFIITSNFFLYFSKF